MALSLNFGFFYGDIGNLTHHSVFMLFAAIVINLISTVLKIGDRSQLGALLLASSLVADLLLIGGSIVWLFAAHILDGGLTSHMMSIIVQLSGGALVANFISVIILLIDAAALRR